MTFSYTVADLTSADATTAARAKVRLRLGDVEAAGHLLENEEIGVYLTEYGTTDLPVVALKCARLMLGRLQKANDINGAGIQSSRSQRFSQMKDLIRELEVETMGGQTLILTGTVADQEAIAADTSRSPPIFSVGWDRYR